MREPPKCPRCGVGMDSIPPSDPPFWLEAWECRPCRVKQVVALGCAKEIAVDFGFGGKP